MVERGPDANQTGVGCIGTAWLQLILFFLLKKYPEIAVTLCNS